jgi:hypothetical protein
MHWVRIGLSQGSGEAILSCDRVTIDRILIGNRIYWTPNNSCLHFVKHCHRLVLGQSSLHCLVVASSSRYSPSCGFLKWPRPQLLQFSDRTDCLSSSQAGAISHQPPTLLTAISGLSYNGSWSLLYSFSMDSTENTSPNSSSVVAWHSCWHGPHRQYHFQQFFCCCMLSVAAIA